MSTCETHLGISRNNKNTNKDTINARIINARCAMYSLMGAGLHGLNGVGPEVAIAQYNTCSPYSPLRSGSITCHGQGHRGVVKIPSDEPAMYSTPAKKHCHPSYPPSVWIPPNKSINTHENPNHLQRYRSLHNRNTTSFLPEANPHAAIGDEGQHINQLDSSAKEDPSKIWATVSRRDLGDAAKETILGPTGQRCYPQALD